MSHNNGRRRARLVPAMLAGSLALTYATGPWSAGTPAAADSTSDNPHSPVWIGVAGQARDRTSPTETGQPTPVSSDSPPDSPPSRSAELGIPGVVLDAYRRAAADAARREPGCHLGWQLLAAIGKVESDHAEQGAVDAGGTAIHPIYGPELNGQNGYAAIPADQPAAFDGASWARAVGPMQFIPSTWHNWAVGAHGTTGADPENIYDATETAAGYLCADGRDLSTPDGLRTAILSYNDSPPYLATVLEWDQAYSTGVVAVPDATAGSDSPTIEDAAAVQPISATPARQPIAPPPPPPPAAPIPPVPPTGRPPTRPPAQPPANPVTMLVTGVVGLVGQTAGKVSLNEPVRILGIG